MLVFLLLRCLLGYMFALNYEVCRPLEIAITIVKQFR